jgi:LacI family transcriptional regulator
LVLKRFEELRVKHRPTIRDVARKAGLSLSTVSLVINNRGNVSPETRAGVQKVIRELSYHPTRSARGLASKTSGNIGFILSEEHFSQAEPFYTRIFLGTEFEARDHNFYILLTTVGDQFDPDTYVPRFLLERNVDGIIVAGKVNEKLISYIDSLGLPIVLVDYEMKRAQHSAVLIDNWRGATLAVEHLLALGHRKIAFIGGDIRHPSLTDRFEAYQNTLRQAGVVLEGSYEITDEEETSVEGGAGAAERLFASGARPTAIFAANDAMAIGCMRYLKSRGVGIPGDVAVVGFDDIEMSSHIEPHLTTVRVLKEEMGKIAVQRVVDSINAKTRIVVTTHVPVELIVRESTVKAAQVGD